MPDTPFVTHRDRRWSGAKVPCAACGQRVRSGITNRRDLGNPPVRVICHLCWHVGPPIPLTSGESGAE